MLDCPLKLILIAPVFLDLAKCREIRPIEAILNIVVPNDPSSNDANHPKPAAFLAPGNLDPFFRDDLNNIPKSLLLKAHTFLGIINHVPKC